MYKHYEADTEADKVAPLVLHVLSLWCFFAMVVGQWLAKTFLIALLQKELICTSVKEKFEESCRKKIYSVSQVQIKFVIARAKR